MVKNHESEIDMIVSVYEGDKIIPPCGRCRELITQLDANNYETKVILDEGNVKLLSELLPCKWN